MVVAADAPEYCRAMIRLPMMLAIAAVAGITGSTASAATPAASRIVAWSSANPVLIDPSTGKQSRFTLRRAEHSEDVLVRAPNGAIAETGYPSSTSGPTYIWSTTLAGGKRTRTGPLDGYVVSFAFPQQDASRVVGPYRVDRRQGSQVLPSESGLAIYDLMTATRTVLVSYRAVEIPSVFGPGAPPQAALLDTIGPSASWSPDGTRVLYVHTHDARKTNAADVPYEELVSVRTDGSDAIVLTHGGQVRRPVWSPDGSTIAFESTRSSAGLDPNVPTRIDLVSADGTGRRTAYAGSAVRPAWSPSGRYLAFETLRGPYTSGARLLDTRTGRVRTLGVRMDSHHAGLSWSPTTDRLAACGRNGLSLFAPSGKRIRRLGQHVCFPSWSPGPTLSG